MAQIPDDSRACPRCRAKIMDVSPVLAATDIARDLPEQEKRIRSLLIGIVLLAALAWVAGTVVSRVRSRKQEEFSVAQYSPSERIPVVKSAVQLRAGAPVSFGFAVPAGCRSVTLQAQFPAGTEQAMATTQMTVFDEASYTSWRNHSASRAVYSGKIRGSITNLSLPAEAKRYFLVLSQGASALPATVQADVVLLCNRGAC